MRLGLVNANFSDNSFRTFCEFFQGSKYLQELHLSGVECKIHAFKDFFNALENNKKLTYLNLSWNQFFSEK